MFKDKSKPINSTLPHTRGRSKASSGNQYVSAYVTCASLNGLEEMNMDSDQSCYLSFCVITKRSNTLKKSIVTKIMSAKSTENGAADTSALSQSATLARHHSRLTQYWEEICGYIRVRFGVGPPDPEEIVQTAFEKILSKSNFDTINNPRAFLYTIAYNTAIDMIRSQNRLSNFKSKLEDNKWTLLEADELTPERALLSKEDYQIALDTINCMPEIERETLILYRIHGLTLVEISERIGKSKTSVIRYLASAMRRLVEASRRFEDVQ